MKLINFALNTINSVFRTTVSVNLLLLLVEVGGADRGRAEGGGAEEVHQQSHQQDLQAPAGSCQPHPRPASSLRRQPVVLEILLTKSRL